MRTLTRLMIREEWPALASCIGGLFEFLVAPVQLGTSQSPAAIQHSTFDIQYSIFNIPSSFLTAVSHCKSRKL
jgi:hypothetical protein